MKKKYFSFFTKKLIILFICTANLWADEFVIPVLKSPTPISNATWSDDDKNFSYNVNDIQFTRDAFTLELKDTNEISQNNVESTSPHSTSQSNSVINHPNSSINKSIITKDDNEFKIENGKTVTLYDKTGGKLKSFTSTSLIAGFVLSKDEETLVISDLNNVLHFYNAKTGSYIGYTPKFGIKRILTTVLNDDCSKLLITTEDNSLFIANTKDILFSPETTPPPFKQFPIMYNAKNPNEKMDGGITEFSVKEVLILGDETDTEFIESAKEKANETQKFELADEKKNLTQEVVIVEQKETEYFPSTIDDKDKEVIFSNKDDVSVGKVIEYKTVSGKTEVTELESEDEDTLMTDTNGSQNQSDTSMTDTSVLENQTDTLMTDTSVPTFEQEKVLTPKEKSALEKEQKKEAKRQEKLAKQQKKEEEKRAKELEKNKDTSMTDTSGTQNQTDTLMTDTSGTQNQSDTSMTDTNDPQNQTDTPMTDTNGPRAQNGTPRASHPQSPNGTSDVSHAQSQSPNGTPDVSHAQSQKDDKPQDEDINKDEENENPPEQKKEKKKSPFEKKIEEQFDLDEEEVLGKFKDGQGLLLNINYTTLPNPYVCEIGLAIGYRNYDILKPFYFGGTIQPYFGIPQYEFPYSYSIKNTNIGSPYLVGAKLLAPFGFAFFPLENSFEVYAEIDLTGSIHSLWNKRFGETAILSKPNFSFGGELKIGVAWDFINLDICGSYDSLLGLNFSANIGVIINLGGSRNVGGSRLK